MNIYFTADLHLGHDRIIDMCRRPFRSVREMNEALIANWNARVGADDEVYILGDLICRSESRPEALLSGLSGRKHLILGNHDGEWLQRLSCPEAYFESISMMKEIIYGDRLLTLCHSPMLEWNGSRKDTGGLLIHGHIHNDKAAASYSYIRDHLPRALNAGTDINGFMPVTPEELTANNDRWYVRKPGTYFS